MVERITPGRLPPIDPEAGKVSPSQSQPATSFGEVLKASLQEVNELQGRADELQAAFAAGEMDDIAQVMQATAEANLAFNLTMQIRNKLVEAYQELMRMQV